MSDAQSSGQLEVGSDNKNNKSDLKTTHSKETSIRNEDEKKQADEEIKVRRKKSQLDETNDNDLAKNEITKQNPTAETKQQQQQQQSIQSTSSRRARPAPPKRLELRRVPPPPGTTAPPKRPDQLPASYAARPHFIGTLPGGGVVPAVSGSSSQPVANRYSWAQLQHWRRLEEAAVAGETTAAHHPSSLSAHFQGASRGVALVVNPMQMVNLSEHTKSKLIKIIEALKRFSEQWFSHVLLLMFLAVYACFGAYVFISFEANTEELEKGAIEEARRKLIQDFWISAHKENQSTFSQFVIQELDSYERLLARTFASGMTSNSHENQWTFWGGLFYSMTVFTTIGYGHLTPVTFAGRVATMVYAIFGIPILLMVLADLGKLLTRIIKFAFKQFRLMRHKLLHWRASVRTRRIISERFHEGVAALRSAFSRALTRLRPSWFRCPARVRSVLITIGKFFARSEPKKKRKKKKEGDEEEEEAVTTTDSLPDGPHQIVTPPKQTKPVSPTVNQSRPGFGPLAGFGNPGHHHAYQHHHAHPSLPRAHSPGRQGGTSLNSRHHRKGSSSMKQHRNFQVSRSSSSSVVAGQGQSLNSPSSVQSNKSVIIPNLPQPDENKCQQVEETDKESIANDKDEKEAKVGQVDDKNQDTKKPTNSSTSTTKSQHGDDVDDEEDNFEEDELLEEDDSVILGEDDERFQLEDDDFDIPVSFALFLLVTYMMLGAVVFSIWEGWNFFDSLYFVFISMSTIGFGDLVPQHPKRMIGTFIYLLFGLALTSMCINVVQEKIHATFLRAKMQIGEKMGLDLDQIMADDYYEGSMIDDYCDADCLSETGHSHFNESAGLNEVHNNQQQFNIHDNNNNNNNNQTAAIELTSANSIRLSRSSHSLRSKSKRQAPAALPAHSNPTSGGGGSLLRRQASKRLSRQVTPSSPTTTTTATTTTETEGQAAPGVLESPIGPSEKRRLSERAQVADSEQVVAKDADNCNIMLKSRTDNRNQSTMNSRPRLIGTRSHPEETPVDEQQAKEGDENCKVFVTSDRKREEELRTRSANSSRRSSVSHELNQLDDLILTLSRSATNSQDGRFGPLLGIPVALSVTSSATLINRGSENSSRSNSPITSNSLRSSPAAQQNKNHMMLPIPRRGTSMTSRRSASPKESSSVTRKISSPSSPSSFRRVRASMNHINDVNSNSSNSNQVCIDLALENSQKAIDELEAVKLSIL